MSQLKIRDLVKVKVKFKDKVFARIRILPLKHEIHVYVILLLVTFAFLILTTPGTIILLYIIQVDIDTSPEAYAKFYFLESFTEKLFYTNCCINFFLYVISGRKFRKDLVNLLICRNLRKKEPSKLSDVNTVDSVLEE